MVTIAGGIKLTSAGDADPGALFKEEKKRSRPCEYIYQNSIPVLDGYPTITLRCTDNYAIFYHFRHATPVFIYNFSNGEASMTGMEKKEVWAGSLDQTPLGPLSAAVSRNGLIRVIYGNPELLKGEYGERLLKSGAPYHLPHFLDELSTYLAGRLKQFTTPVDWDGMAPFSPRRARSLCPDPLWPGSDLRAAGSFPGQAEGRTGDWFCHGSQPIADHPALPPGHRIRWVLPRLWRFWRVGDQSLAVETGRLPACLRVMGILYDK